MYGWTCEVGLKIGCIPGRKKGGRVEERGDKIGVMMRGHCRPMFDECGESETICNSVGDAYTYRNTSAVK